MGVLMVLLVGLGDRIDASLSGGAFPILGGTAWAITMALSALFFGLPGAIIAGEIQALMDVALGVPLAPAFIVANAVGPLAFALISHRLPMQSGSHYLLALAPAVVLATFVWGSSWRGLSGSHAGVRAIREQRDRHQHHHWHVRRARHS